MYARRDLLKFGMMGAAAAGAATLPTKGLAQGYFGSGGYSGQGYAPSGYASYGPGYSGQGYPGRLSTLAPRHVAVHNLHTGESLEAVYYDRGAYVPDALAAMNRVLRDFRTGDVYHMDPQLFDLLHTLSTTVDSREPFQIISGYRSPKTNEMLHETTPGVANNSYHMRGMATDIRLPDVQLAHLHKAALLLGRGGVGYYPSSDFVHVDVGPVRSWG